MANQAIHDQTMKLGVGQDFANAVLYSLSDHPAAVRSPRGIVLPMNEDVWQRCFKEVFRKRYATKDMQSLAKYCSYFRRGEHGIGYDQNGRRDFGRGTRRTVKNNRFGQRVVEDPTRAIWPGKEPRLAASEVIRLAKSYWEANHPDGKASASAVFRGIQNGESSVDDSVDAIIRDPTRREMLIEAFERNARWARMARKLYGYECMAPDCRFELVKEDGERYIEVHHVIPMCDGGSPNDKMNLSVLCPNHHREIHFATKRRRDELAKFVRGEQARRLKRVRGFIPD